MYIGEKFKDRYRIIDILGQGGMSTVYLAENIKLGTYWAIKQIKKDSFDKFNLAAEPNMLKKFEHPALPRIFDILEDDNCIYFVMDYVEGVALDKKLSKEGPFAEDVVISWALELCDVLHYLHSQKPNPVIYRDMKPSNIILTGSGKLKLIDFGIAREYKQQSTNDTVYIGTRGYAAPEQYGCGQTTAATDIYSLGMTLFELLTGISPNDACEGIEPFKGMESFKGHVGRLSPDMEEILFKCTRYNPEERYSSALELKSALEKLKEAKYDNGKSHANTIFRQRSRELGKHAGSRTVYKKLVITVWDNAEFGCELAYAAAELSGFSVMLIDMDLLAPKADIFLGVKRYQTKAQTASSLGKTGLAIAMEALDKNNYCSDILFEAAVRRRELSNLYILTGIYDISDYEYYSERNAIKLIENAYLNFDLTVLLVNKSIYDSFTVCALLKSDYNFVAVRPDMDKLREFNSYIAFLKEKQKIPPEKTKFLAYEYQKNLDLSYDILKEATGNNFLGAVSYCRKRAVYRNLRGAYASRMEKQVKDDYARILESMKIIPARGLKDRLKERMSSVFGLPNGILKLSGKGVN